MNSRMLGVVAVFCFSMLSSAWAAPYALVDSVQPPVWVERDGKRLPAYPGMELRNRDQLLTGGAARAILQLGDGSAVKLGENVQMGVDALNQQPDGLFSAALDVVKGAFRLTTNALRKLQSPRAINVRVGTVTAGIRGTDIWGRSDAASDFICLLEGHILVSHPEGEPAELTVPLQVYGADKGMAPDAIALADAGKIAEWAPTTELQADAASLQRGGAWVIRVQTAPSQEAALNLYDLLSAAGYLTKIHPKGTPGHYRYEVLVGPFADERNAKLLSAQLLRQFAIDEARVLKRQAAFRPRQ